MSALTALTINGGHYNVMAFGARADGVSLDTHAIQAAIDAAAQAGGGLVYFPAGNYLLFSVQLKSNIELHLSSGATLIAANQQQHAGCYHSAEDNPWDMFQDFGHSHWHNSLLWAENETNIAITGMGCIYGKGLTAHGPGPRRIARAGDMPLSLKGQDPHGEINHDPAAYGHEMRGEGNKAIAFKQCRRIMVRDIRILRGGHFAILATGVDQLTLDNLLVDTNRDGIDIDCCRHVTVSRCHVNAPNDDAIVLKSSFALGKAIITEQVSISHCHVSGYDVGTVFDGSYGRSQQQAPDNDGVTGRIKLGTESNGGFRNITINDCQFERSRGLAIESVDGAIIDNITINNLVMRDVVNAPLFIRLGARLRAPADHPVGSINNIMISNLIATEVDARYASIIAGLADHPITNIKLTNISISHGGGGQCRDAERHLAELATAYPEPSMFGITPVHGLFVRHVDNMSVNEMDIHCEQPEQRPALGFYQVTRARIGAIQLSGQHNNQLIAEPLNNASCSINQ